jgi:sigma-B regulation protein RsbU (phosphoserine phosphatase)
MEFLLVIALILLGVALRLYHVRVRTLERQLASVRRQRREVMDFLSLFTTSLSTVADMERAMELVAHYACDLLEAESLCIFCVAAEDGRRELKAGAAAGLFPPLSQAPAQLMARRTHWQEHLRHLRIPFGEGPVGRVAQTQQPLCITDAANLPEADRLPREIRTLLAVPMFVENRLTGVVVAVNCKQPGRLFGASDLRTLETISYQAALASHLVSIYGERFRQERLVQELSLAQQIQTSLLPEVIPAFGPYAIHAATRSALEVGGDFYDFIRIDENRLMILVADASGKGVPACMLMAMCQSFARAGAERFTVLETFLRDLHRHLYRNSDRSHFVTLAAVVIDQASHVCEYARAGHTELLLRLANGTTRVIKPAGGAIGLLPDELNPAFDTLLFAMPPGTGLMLFTDGITDAVNDDGELFGLERLEQLWTQQGLSPEQMSSRVLDEVRLFAGSQPQADDQTLLIIERPAAPGE